MSNHSDAAAHVHHSDYEGAKIGMWLFLFTEVLLFGGLFLLYSVYRARYPLDFHLAASELNTFVGTINTLFLLTSSLTVVLALEAHHRGSRKVAMGMLGVTIFFGLGFMVIKYFEWSAKFHHGLYPGAEELLSHSGGEIVFFNLYYAMTGLHGLHVLVGMAVLGTILYFIAKEPDTSNQRTFIKLENSALYWHLVDVIWIFLFPLFYLIT